MEARGAGGSLLAYVSSGSVAAVVAGGPSGAALAGVSLGREKQVRLPAHTPRLSHAGPPNGSVSPRPARARGEGNPERADEGDQETEARARL